MNYISAFNNVFKLRELSFFKFHFNRGKIVKLIITRKEEKEERKGKKELWAEYEYTNEQTNKEILPIIFSIQ